MFGNKGSIVWKQMQALDLKKLPLEGDISSNHLNLERVFNRLCPWKNVGTEKRDKFDKHNTYILSQHGDYFFLNRL